MSGGERWPGELAMLRDVAKAASDFDWHIKRTGKGRLTGTDYDHLWPLRDALDTLRDADSAAEPVTGWHAAGQRATASWVGKMVKP